MQNEETTFEMTLVFDEDTGEYKTDINWMQYDVPIDIDCAVNMLTLIAHSFIDLQDECDQIEFENYLIKSFKKAMIERFDSIEPYNDDDT